MSLSEGIFHVTTNAKRPSTAVDRGHGGLQLVVSAGPAQFVADQPAPAGLDLGPTPHEIVAAGLAACTAQTLRLYAQRKGWALGRVEVRVVSSTDAAADPPERLERTILLEGELDEAQRARLLQIAEACPIHKMLTRGSAITTALATPAVAAAD